MTVELASTVEPDWANYVQEVSHRAGIAVRQTLPHYQAHGLIHVQARSTLQAYLTLEPASQYIMPRKWLPVAEYFAPRMEEMLMHLNAYNKVTELVQGGMVRAQACALVKEEYGVKGNTVQFWVYNDQKPRLLCLPEVI
jgi:hypothetical protein